MFHNFSKGTTITTKRTIQKVNHAVALAKVAQRCVVECREALYDPQETEDSKNARHRHVLKSSRMVRTVTDQLFVWYKQTDGGSVLPLLKRFAYTAETLHIAVEKAVTVQTGQYGEWSVAWMSSNRVVSVGRECLETLKAEGN